MRGEGKFTRPGRVYLKQEIRTTFLGKDTNNRRVIALRGKGEKGGARAWSGERGF